MALVFPLKQVFSSCTSVSNSALVAPPLSYMALTSVISWAMAVFIFRLSISALTFLMVWCIRVSMAGR